MLTFIAAAVSLPIAHLAFAINWPLLPGAALHWEDGIALVTIFAGLVMYVSIEVIKCLIVCCRYRVASMMKARAEAKAKEVDLVTPDEVTTRKGV